MFSVLWSVATEGVADQLAILETSGRGTAPVSACGAASVCDQHGESCSEKDKDRKAVCSLSALHSCKIRVCTACEGTGKMQGEKEESREREGLA